MTFNMYFRKIYKYLLQQQHTINTNFQQLIANQQHISAHNYIKKIRPAMTKA